MKFQIVEKSAFKLDVNLTMKEGSPLIKSVSWWVGRPRHKEAIWTKQVRCAPPENFTILIPAQANICATMVDEDRFVVVAIKFNDNNVVHSLFNYRITACPVIPYIEDEDMFSDDSIGFECPYIESDSGDSSSDSSYDSTS